MKHETTNGSETMKKSEIKKGGLYTAKVSGQLTTVRVDKYVQFHNGRWGWEVTNLKSGRRLTFRSAQKFRREVAEQTCPE